jgi:hypothetical protein
MEKIRCTVSNVKQLTSQLHSDIKQLNQRWPFEQKSFQKALTSTSEWYHLFLLIISHHPKSIDKSYEKMFDECRFYYKGNVRMLEHINLFAETYKPDNAIREYTRDGFLYRIINGAFYERYLKQNCTENTKEVIECLYFAGELYQFVCDNEQALKLYQQILHIDEHNQFLLRNEKVQKQIKQLNKTDKHKSKQRTIATKDVEGNYQAQEEQWQIFWALNSHKDKKIQKRGSLHRLREYLIDREHWYDDSDFRIVFRLPYQTNKDASIEFYQYQFSLAIQRHLMSTVFTTYLTNNRSLSLYRYKKYLRGNLLNCLIAFWMKPIGF